MFTRLLSDSSAFFAHIGLLTRQLTSLLVITLFSNMAFAQVNQPYSVPPKDAPELAAIGEFAVGWRTLTLTNPDQPDLPKMARTLGISRSSDRVIKVDVWYPAAKQSADPGAKQTAASYVAPLPRSKDPERKTEFTHKGIAFRDAAPLTGRKFPLVLVSHGFGGWSTFMTYLTENLASKGFVVAAIDHADASFTDGASFGLSFGSTIVHRARDQQFALSELTALSKSSTDTLGAIIDAQSIAVIGYSMGGFGALATAGAGYDASSATLKQIPAAMVAPLTEGNATFAATRPANIKALVLIAPWGSQPSQRTWSTKSLQALRAPTFFIVGDADDIVDRAQGVGYLFEHATRTSRHLLVFQNARHNTGGNPAPSESTTDFVSREYFDEPVWRKDRMNAITQHFVTAFLELHLKGKSDRAAYLDVQPTRSNDGTWNVPFGQSTGDKYASGSGDTASYWRGFQRRWAVGLEMHHKKATE
jgi:predicted dienelactone hydrolase